MAAFTEADRGRLLQQLPTSEVKPIGSQGKTRIFFLYTGLMMIRFQSSLIMHQNHGATLYLLHFVASNVWI